MRDFLRFIFLLLVILAVIVVGISYYVVRLARPPIGDTVTGQSGPIEVVFEVLPGDSTSQIAGRLADQGLIRGFLFIPGSWIFRGWASLRGMDRDLEAGRYILRSDMSIDQILDTLSKAPAVEEVTFTIREGLRLEEVAEQLNQQRIVSNEEFLAALERDYAYGLLSDRPEAASLEGYLFPDTYTIPRTFTATEVVDFVLKNFDERFTPEMRQWAQDRGMTIYEVVTLASIVEREAVLDEERPIVASVYLNRLEVGMALEADPTVQYALGYHEEQGRWWPALFFDELGINTLSEVDHPYNTYRHAGLPPGPICSPGLASLRAVVQPTDTDYYYFVAKGDGSGEHAFARTLEEHNVNVSRYQP